MKSYDTTVTRLILILTKLDNGERLTQSELAKEFGVSLRTVQRDLNRLSYFPIEKNRDGTLQFIEGFSLKRTSFEEMEMLLMYLSLSLVVDISPKFSKSAHSLVSKLLVPNFSTPYLIKHDPYESIDMDSSQMNEIEFAINNKRIIHIKMHDSSHKVEPYKIVSFDEIWYLFAKELNTEKIKTFFISDITHIETTQKTFTLHRSVDSILENVHTACFEDGVQFDVKIKVMQPIAHFFKRKKHLASQETIEEYDDGSMLISFKVSAYEEVDNLIKSWLPHVEVISPAHLQDKIVDELEEYIKPYKKR